MIFALFMQPVPLQQSRFYYFCCTRSAKGIDYKPQQAYNKEKQEQQEQEAQQWPNKITTRCQATTRSRCYISTVIIKSLKQAIRGPFLTGVTQEEQQMQENQQNTLQIAQELQQRPQLAALIKTVSEIPPEKQPEAIGEILKRLTDKEK